MNHLYPNLERQLRHLDAEMIAAECHGVLSARFCVETTPDVEDWIHEVLGPQEQGDLQVEASQQLLGQLYQKTEASFDDAMAGFVLFLPDDSEELAVRSRALADWCGGFMAGLGLGGLQDDESLNPQVKEVMQDLNEIARMDEDVSDSEENELAYMEIVEYVRVAVMTIGLSLRTPNASRTLH